MTYARQRKPVNRMLSACRSSNNAFITHEHVYVTPHIVVLQRNAASSTQEESAAQAQTAREEREPVVYPKGVHWEGLEPHLPPSLLQRAPLRPSEDC